MSEPNWRGDQRKELRERRSSIIDHRAFGKRTLLEGVIVERNFESNRDKVQYFISFAIPYIYEKHCN